MIKRYVVIYGLLFFILINANEKAFMYFSTYTNTPYNGFSIPVYNSSSYIVNELLKSPQLTDIYSHRIIPLFKKMNIKDVYEFLLKGENIENNNNIKYSTASYYKYSGFLTDTTIEDSIFYEQAYKFYMKKSSYDYLLYLLNETDKFLKMDKEEIVDYIKNKYKNRFAIYDDNNNTIYDSLNIIIDNGGDDTYFLKKKNSIIIDLSGNDTYIFEDYACAINGYYIIIDFDGNDTYSGNEYSIGCAINGVNIINDRNGNDVYKGKFMVIGAAINGIGGIIDENGNDRYISSGFSQGFGAILGLGFIYDHNGNDFYGVSGGIKDHRENNYHSHLSQGFGFGIRDQIPGGFGILYDVEGNDVYSGEYFVQGSSYWYAFGLLYDENGDDIYTARRYAQGAGTHFTIGTLIDMNGNDNYYSWGVSQGCGHDFAIGFLYDYKGDDNYYSDWLSQGAGNANGIGILFEFDGQNNYSNIKTSLGYSNIYRKMPSLGVLYDLNYGIIINGEKIDKEN